MFEYKLSMKEIAKRLDKKLPSKDCVICGTSKIITNLRDYAWRIGSRVCCSYKCYRILEKDVLKNRNRDLIQR